MKTNEVLHLSGATDEQIAPTVAKLLTERKTQCLLVVSSAAKARELSKTLAFFLPWNIYIIQEDESPVLQYEAKSQSQLEDRLTALTAFSSGELCVVIAPVTGAIRRLPPLDVFISNRISLETGATLDPELLKQRLRTIGYERCPMVEGKGQFSVRGGIIDVFGINNAYPYRIDFFDDEIDSIKCFDPETQRSTVTLDCIELWPAKHLIMDPVVFNNAAAKLGASYDKWINKSDGSLAAALKAQKEQLLHYLNTASNVQYLEHYIDLFYSNISHIWDYMNNGLVLLQDPDRLRELISLRDRETESDFNILLEKGRTTPDDLERLYEKNGFNRLLKTKPMGFFTPFNTIPEGLKPTERRQITAKALTPIAGRLDLLETELKRYIKQKYRITIVVSNESRLDNLKDYLVERDLFDRVSLEIGDISSGMEFPLEKTVYLADREIFSAVKQRKRPQSGKSKHASPIKAFSDITQGDFVVHETHGVGRYVGIEQLTVQDTIKDYLKIKYAGEDILYIPVDQMSLVQKYIGDATPKISRLSSGEWKKAKARAKRDIANMAQDLLSLSAVRKSELGYSFSEDSVWQKEFEEKFPYNETQDQLRSVVSIKADMEQATPMDRLLCGDVGYGKTEVAARAVFKCVADGKQAAILAPTTILVNQHYHTFTQRFEDFPFEVEMLSRFRTAGEQEKIISRIKKGAVDVIIGTHRLLSRDVGFKDLGLLVIDEEQRFGVKHKEMLKQLRKNVDVLTMTATPIPRTLHLSLAGIRDMDIIEEPPEDRYPVQTYVMEQTDEVIKDTLRRELEREGQVYIVYNRVNGIHRVAAEIKKLAPEAEVAVGHGQMNETELEDVMMDFINGKSNVLVCTTIIESGIDIPNVNTILIMDAERFGLAQLYQLRGRVGRSNRVAYAYLLYKKDKVLTQEAEKRLKAVREFTEFGSGFKIALKDLEIRGAGNLLGIEQSGHMMSIGYELYCKLVDEAVRALSGEVVNPDSEDVSFEIPVTAYIPSAYIEDEVQKLEMYKKIAFVDNIDDERDIIDELIDRFGDIPLPVQNLIKVAGIRAAAKRLGILRLREAHQKYFFEFKPSPRIDAESVAVASERFKGRVLIHGGQKPFIGLRASGKDALKEVAEFVNFLEKR